MTAIPRGVDFVPTDERLHFASVLAFHPASGTLCVDDTLTWLELPLLGGLRFHARWRKSCSDDREPWSNSEPGSES